MYQLLAIGYALTVAEAGLLLLVEVGFFFIACGVLGLGFRFQRRRAEEAAEHARLVGAHARAIHAEATTTERNRPSFRRSSRRLPGHWRTCAPSSALSAQTTHMTSPTDSRSPTRPRA
ncbi:hypothetical protein [Gordonia shandongensis]|uniref:hypothetical protein n=1 Tax=Gordonia shandongensis TaxID=376351 RepID=UPI0012ECB673|nr:hypothetical protein [Gordonia shandongensis]